MLLLALVCVLSLTVSWRYISINLGLMGEEFELDKVAGPLGEALMPYAILFPPLAFWHFFDSIEREGNPERWRGWLSSYRSFLVFLLLASPIAILAAPGGINPSGCYEMFPREAEFYDACTKPPASDLLLVLVVMPVMAFACISKAITAVLSRVGSGAHGKTRED